MANSNVATPAEQDNTFTVIQEVFGSRISSFADLFATPAPQTIERDIIEDVPEEHDNSQDFAIYCEEVQS